MVAGVASLGSGGGSRGLRGPRYKGVLLKKSLGQNILVDQMVLAQVVMAAHLQGDDTVVEVGAGSGVLTRELAKRVQRVVAVEIDEALADTLHKEFLSYPNVEIIHGDILELPLASLLTPQGSDDEAVSYKVVANLPYNITSPVLRYFLEEGLRPTEMVVMVQKEVAESIVAGPGHSNSLSVAVHYFGQPQIVATVSPRSFYPSPKVESAILRIQVHTKPPVDAPSAAALFKVVKAGFSAKRKQLHNALAQSLGIKSSEAAELLEESGIGHQRRAESLSLEEWASLARAWASRAGSGQESRSELWA
ncbi:MAG: rsmA [Dehalococcoidia bacterium]|nr:rsmA [Dehalococcoidia bacterium]